MNRIRNIMNHLNPFVYPKLNLSNFKNIITHSESPTSIYNKKRITYFDQHEKEIGYIEYNLYTGKICLFFITEKKYRNRGLGPQILEHVLNDMRQYGTKRAWLVTLKCPHPFWERHGFTYMDPPDFSVTLHGYSKQL